MHIAHCTHMHSFMPHLWQGNKRKICIISFRFAVLHFYITILRGREGMNGALWANCNHWFFLVFFVHKHMHVSTNPFPVSRRWRFKNILVRERVQESENTNKSKYKTTRIYSLKAHLGIAQSQFKFFFGWIVGLYHASMHANVLYKPFYMIKLITAKWIDNGNEVHSPIHCSSVVLQSAFLPVSGAYASTSSTHRVQIGENEAHTMAFAQPFRLSQFGLFSVSSLQSFLLLTLSCDWCASEYFTQLRHKINFHIIIISSRSFLVPFTIYAHGSFLSPSISTFCIHLPTIFIISEWALVRVRQHRRTWRLNCRLMLNIILSLCIDTIKITSKKKNSKRENFFVWKINAPCE